MLFVTSDGPGCWQRFLAKLQAETIEIIGRERLPFLLNGAVGLPFKIDKNGNVCDGSLEGLSEKAMTLQIRGISKTYPNGVQALKDVALTIPEGMYGLLGPNGAGKSTLMRILATLQEPDGGSVQLGGIDVLNQKDEVRQTLGRRPQEFGVYPKVNAEDLLEHFAILKGIAGHRARKEAAIQAVGRRAVLKSKT